MKHFVKKYKSEIIVGISALSAGVLSFFLTLNIRPILKENKINATGIVAIQNDKNNEQNEGGIKVVHNVDVEKVKEDIRKFEEFADLAENYEKTKVEEKSPNKENEVEVNIEVQEINIEKEEEPQKIILATSNNLIEQKELEFDLPISGDIVLGYAKEKLVYSETLDEWITHEGVDIKSEEGTPVKASEKGVIESIKMDPRYGNLIIIKHNEEYKSVYSNLNLIDNVYAGKAVTKGEIIASVAEGFGFESKEGPHVHFEIIKNGETQKPY